MRLWVYVLCIIDSLNTIWHYGIAPITDKGKTFVIVEILRYTIFFLVCYYYCDKAKKLLTYKEDCISVLKVVYILTLIASVAFGIAIGVEINEDDNGMSDGKNLCDRLEFQMFRWMPLVMCAVYQYTFWDIQN